MAGHSHWANIARKKALVDNKRGKLWSKLAKAIIVAAKRGGDPDSNRGLLVRGHLAWVGIHKRACQLWLNHHGRAYRGFDWLAVAAGCKQDDKAYWQSDR